MTRGVEVRPHSIRLSYSLGGVEHRHTLMLHGNPLPPTPANVRYAARLAQEIRQRIAYGTFSAAEYFPASGQGAGAVTVESQLATWLAAQRIEQSTHAAYSSASKFWSGSIGGVLLRSLKHSDVLTVLAERSDLSGKTVNNYVSVLREALALAVRDGLLSDNPALLVPRAKHQKPPVDPFSRDEAEAIIADLREHYPAPIAGFAEFKFFSGLRTSEAAGLRWRSVDLAAGSLVVSQAIVRGVEKASTKTNTARTVLLNSRAAAALTAQKAHSYLAGEHVWLDPRYGSAWHEERAFRRSYWEPCIKRLGIRYRPPYNTRHSYASMMLMSGRRPAWCALQLGHSVEMFLRVYSKWIPGGQDDAELLGFERWLGPAAKQQKEQAK